jgi:uncharacterized membrane protein
MARPILKIEWNGADWLIEGATLFALLGFVIYLALNYQGLPESIPTHFGANGHADSFGNKSTLLFLMGANVGIYILLTSISRIPHHFNYLVEITEANAHRQYTIALRMMRIIKLAVVISFGYILIRTIFIARGEVATLGVWFLPGMLILIFIPILFYIFQSKKNK